MVLEFMDGYVDMEIGWREKPRLTETSTLYHALAGDKLSERRLRGTDEECLAKRTKRLQEFRRKTVVLLKNHFNSKLFIICFYFLDHLCEDLAKSRNVSLLDAAPYQLFNLDIRREYRKLLVKRAKRMEETSEAV